MPASNTPSRSAVHYRHRALLESLSVEAIKEIAIITSDVHGRITSWPAGAQTVFGFSADEVLGHSIEMLYIPDDREARVALIEMSIAEEKGFSRDVRWHLRKDGTPVFIEGVTRALHDSSGALIGFSKVAQDVTQRRAIEQQLRVNEERLRLFMQNVREYAFMQTDSSGRIVSWNPGAERIFGYSTGEILSKSFAQFLSIEDQGRNFLDAEMSRVLSGQRVESERWLIRKDGSRFWAHWVSEPVRRESGELRTVAKILRDESERKRAEDALINATAALRRSEASLRTILSSLSDAVIATDANGLVKYMNAVAESLTGWQQAAAIDHPIEGIFKLVTFQREPIYECQVRVALSRMEPTSKRRFMLHSLKGIEIPIEDASSPIFDGERLIGAVTVFNDISEQLEAERLQAEDRDRMERNMIAASEALGITRAELQLLSGQLMMAQEQERKRLASELHDDFGQRTALLEFAVENVRGLIGNKEAVAEAIEKLRSQVRDLSESLREASHKLHPSNLETLGLCAAIRALVEEHCKIGHDVTMVEHDVPSTLPSEVETALYRIAQEALRNVVKHAPDSPARIVVSAGNDELRLKVEDAGPGFEINQVRGKKGIGLLSMQERTRSVGGTMELETSPGEGTLICIRVPLPKPANIQVE